MEDRIQILLAKRASGACSDAELEELARWYDTLEKEQEVLPDRQGADMDLYLEQKYDEFLSLSASQHAPKLRTLNWFWRVAAVAILLLGVGSVLYYIIADGGATKPQLSDALTYRASDKPEVHTRYVTLPDSSVVILDQGSTLKLYDSSLNSKTREVALTGTAYFDIHHMPEKPFIIHVGGLKVTVLGTAFNINQKDKRIAVTVTHGKVKVEDAHQLLAVLERNQQVVYTPEKIGIALKNVPSTNDIEWIKTGLVFNDKSLADIAQQLEDRYNVPIHFTNEAVKKCRVSTNSASSGTESLDDLLAFICPAVNATFQHVNGTIIIDGPGCGE